MQCQTGMILDCHVHVEGGGCTELKEGVKSENGLFNKVSAKPKAAVCPSCGYDSFYIDEYKEFSE